MIIDDIAIERRQNGTQCGTLRLRLGDREAALLWIALWRRGQRVVVEFVPGEGATCGDVRQHHAALVDAVVRTVFERVSRKALFS
ncbi:MAG TPA: hypothetical protein V6D47_12250 [Oscillatoriaceae cyanobacterium]